LLSRRNRYYFVPKSSISNIESLIHSKPILSQIQIITCLAFAVLLIIGCTGGGSSEQPDMSDAQAARQAGLEYLDQGKLPEAEQEFMKLIELEPEEVIGYTNLGIVKMRQGKFSEAEDFLKKALSLEQDNVTVRLNLFELYQQMDQP
jgi:Tfp pilus assembly protein PilF